MAKAKKQIMPVSEIPQYLEETNVEDLPIKIGQGKAGWLRPAAISHICHLTGLSAEDAGAEIDKWIKSKERA